MEKLVQCALKIWSFAPTTQRTISFKSGIRDIVEKFVYNKIVHNFEWPLSKVGDKHLTDLSDRNVFPSSGALFLCL